MCTAARAILRFPCVVLEKQKRRCQSATQLTISPSLVRRRVRKIGDAAGTTRWLSSAATVAAAPSSTITYEYISCPTTFESACQTLSESSSTVAIDLECDYRYYRYAIHLCLIQICDDSNTIYLVDPLAVGCLNALVQIIEDPNIQIIWHGANSDIHLLDRLYGCRPRNIFDTEMAARLAGHQRKSSLQALLRKYFGVDKDPKLSLANWNIRPIPTELLQYAALDVAFLHRLKDLLTAELKEKNRFGWIQEENLALEESRYKPGGKNSSHRTVKGWQELDSRGANILQGLLDVRDRLARQDDQPVFRIIPDEALVDLARNPPTSVEAWRVLHGVHPAIHGEAECFQQAVLMGTIQSMSAKPPPTLADHGILSGSKGPRASTQVKNNGKETANITKCLKMKKEEMLNRVSDEIKKEYPDVYEQILVSRKRLRNPCEIKQGWKRSIIEQTARNLGLDPWGK
jgi:ribonuclease D